MRTILDLDEDILRVAKDLARQRNQSLGRTVSDLARRGLRPADSRAITALGLPALPRGPGAKPVTWRAVRDLLHKEESR